MSESELRASLSQIETQWTLVLKAHQEVGQEAATAQRELMERYAGAVHRYLLYVAHDADTAADLAQDFALRFLRGDFHRADPRRGRFRDYVRGALMNLVVDSHRKKRVNPGPLPDDGAALPDRADDPVDLDRQFLDCWRDELLSRSWKQLKEHERQSGQPFYTVLRYRAEHPGLRSHEIATRLAERVGKPLTAGWVRQTLRRAREKFVGLVREEVSHSLGSASKEEQEDEMRDLGLWEYCRRPQENEPGRS
jgi:RNA polymerase sigma-70 factor (ECF subfamily)